MIRRFYIFFFCLIISNHSYTQVTSIQFDHLDHINELKYLSVTSIAQDTKGYIWFGSQNGLLRYDGYEVKTYKNDLNDSNSISDNNIRAIIADTLGNIWIATQGGGLNKFNLEKEEFTHYKNDPNNSASINGNAVWSLLLDSQGDIWVGTWSNGLGKLNIATGEFTQYVSESKDPVLSIYEDHQGLIWFTSSGLNSYNPKTDQIKNYRNNDQDSTSISSNSIRAIIGDENDNLWIGTENGGLNFFDRETATFKHFQPSINHSNSISSVAVFSMLLKNQEIWLATNAGLNVWNIEENLFRQYKNIPSDSYSLSNDQPRVLFEDNTGNIWIGNEGSRINKVMDTKKFITYQYKPDNPNSLSNNLIRSLYEDDEGFIWIGTQGGGLNRLDRHTNTIQLFGEGIFEGVELSSKDISAIFKDELGIFWIGTWGAGVNRFDPTTNELKVFRNQPHNDNSLPDDRIQAFHIDKFGVFWIATENGLSSFDRANEIWKKFGNENVKLNASNIQGKSFVEEKDGTLWIGTWNGLNKVSSNRNKVEYFASNPENNNSLNNDHVISLHLDEDRKLWLGTFGGGMNMFDLNTGKFKTYTEAEGLSNNTVFGILEDESGNLWLSTNRGLSKFNKQTESFRNFDASEGLQSNEFYWGGSHKNTDGSMMFGGVNGLNVFYPHEIQDNKVIPPVVISDFLIFNKSVAAGKDSPLQKNISYTSKIDLSYKDAVFSFAFSALNFNYPEKNQFAYMLEGFENDWNYVGNKRTATYTNLDPGNYTFKVIASNNDNVWNEEGVALEIIMIPPFWKTWWFYTIMFAFGGSIIYALVKFRERNLEKDKATLQRSIDEARLEVEQQKQAIVEQQVKEKERMWTDKGLAEFGEILSKYRDDIKLLNSNILSALVKYLDISVAAIYLIDENDGEELNMIAAFGYDDVEKSFSIGSGLVGECYKNNEISYLDNLPDDYLKISSGLGISSAGHLLLVPISYEDIHLGVLEIASFNPIEKYKISFMELLASRLTTALNTTQLNETTKKLLEDSKLKAEDLANKEEELRQNMEELQATDEDRARRSKDQEKIILKLKGEIKQLKSSLKK